MVAAAERGEARDDQRGIVEGRLLVALEPALQPARRDTRVALRLLERDQRRQLEQLDEGRPRDLDPQRRLGEREVAPLDRALEDRLRMPLSGDRCSVQGPAGTAMLPAHARNEKLKTGARHPGARHRFVT
jgi:hypothetical protein